MTDDIRLRTRSRPGPTSPDETPPQHQDGASREGRDPLVGFFGKPKTCWSCGKALTQPKVGRPRKVCPKRECINLRHNWLHCEHLYPCSCNWCVARYGDGSPVADDFDRDWPMGGV